MEIRTANIQINNAGGNASENSKNYRVSLPSVWMNQMGISQEDKEVFLQFDGEAITIRKKQSSDFELFYEDAVKKQQHLVLLNFYHQSFLCTKLCANYTTKTLAIENKTDDLLLRAFGINVSPSWTDYEELLEERCLPPKRDGMKYYLAELGLEGYDPLEIIKRTKGRMAEDNFWLEIEER